MTSSAVRLANLRLGALRNPDRPNVDKVAAGHLVCTFTPIRNPVTRQVDKRAMRDAIPSLLYSYELIHEGGTTALVRECDLLALLDGEPLETVKRRRDQEVGDPFELVQAGLPMLWRTRER